MKHLSGADDKFCVSIKTLPTLDDVTENTLLKFTSSNCFVFLIYILFKWFKLKHNNLFISWISWHNWCATCITCIFTSNIYIKLNWTRFDFGCCILTAIDTISSRNRQIYNQWLWSWKVRVLMLTGTNICECKKATSLLRFICKLPCFVWLSASDNASAICFIYSNNLDNIFIDMGCVVVLDNYRNDWRQLVFCWVKNWVKSECFFIHSFWLTSVKIGILLCNSHNHHINP